MTWQERCSQRLSNSLEGDKNLLSKACSEIEIDDYLSKMKNEQFMFSELTYSDEPDLDDIKLGSNRSSIYLFFKITHLDGKEEVKAVKSFNEILQKYSSFKAIKEISQQEYTEFRKQSELTKGVINDIN